MRYLTSFVVPIDQVLAEMNNATLVCYPAGRLTTGQEIWHLVFWDTTENGVISNGELATFIANIHGQLRDWYDGIFTVNEDLVAENLYCERLPAESTMQPIVIAVNTDVVLHPEDFDLIIKNAWTKTRNNR